MLPGPKVLQTEQTENFLLFLFLFSSSSSSLPLLPLTPPPMAPPSSLLPLLLLSNPTYFPSSLWPFSGSFLISPLPPIPFPLPTGSSTHSLSPFSQCRGIWRQEPGWSWGRLGWGRAGLWAQPGCPPRAPPQIPVAALGGSQHLLGFAGCHIGVQVPLKAPPE